jgi:FixJ family two-component response regulator
MKKLTYALWRPLSHVSSFKTTGRALMPQTPVIAIVDDDPSAREGTMDLLNSMGFVTETFKAAEEFLASEQLQRASCLVADVQMPGMTGIELHRRLIASGKNIPTILITAFPDERDRLRAMQSGVICYLIKPYHDEVLLSCIHSALDLESKRE